MFRTYEAYLSPSRFRNQIERKPFAHFDRQLKINAHELSRFIDDLFLRRCEVAQGLDVNHAAFFIDFNRLIAEILAKGLARLGMCGQPIAGLRLAQFRMQGNQLAKLKREHQVVGGLGNRQRTQQNNQRREQQADGRNHG